MPLLHFNYYVIGSYYVIGRYFIIGCYRFSLLLSERVLCISKHHHCGEKKHTGWYLHRPEPHCFPLVRGSGNLLQSSSGSSVVGGIARAFKSSRGAIVLKGKKGLYTDPQPRVSGTSITHKILLKTYKSPPGLRQPITQCL